MVTLPPLTAGAFTVRRIAAGLTLRQPPRTLRPFVIASPTSDAPSRVFVGTRADWRVYPQAQLVQFLLDHTFDADTPLPDPPPLPPLLQDISAEALDLLAMLSLGYAMPEIVALMPDAATHNNELRASGVLPLPPAQSASLLERELVALNGGAPSDAMAALPVDATPTPATPTPATPANLSEPPPPIYGDVQSLTAMEASGVLVPAGIVPAYGAVRSLPAETAAALQVKLASKRVERMSWPFRTMKVGDVVTFPMDQGRAAQRAAHAYAATLSPRAVFRTWTDPRTRDMHIFRMS